MKRFSCNVFCGRASRHLLTAFIAAMWMLPVVAAENPGKGFPVRTSSPVPYATPAVTTTNVIPYAPAPTPQPTVAAPAPAPGTFENSPLTFAGAERRRNGTEPSKGYSMPSIWPALFGVVVICGLFIVALCLMKKYLPGHRQLFNHPAMELLGRTHLDQRRFVTLLRVGRRLVVVGVCSEEMRTLAEITDEAEITEILEVARPKTEVGLTIFQKLFQRNVVEAEAEETRAMAREKVAELDAQMSALRERVKEIRDEEKVPEKPAPKPPRRRQLDAVG